jgi:hypothetical protein
MNLSTKHLPFRSAAIAAMAIVATLGCNKKADNTSNYTSAINTYYSAHPACLFDSPKQFPAQADTSGSGKTSQYDALVDQGLLTRTTAEKKVFIVASKQVNNYDLSDKGRSAWTADPQQPGFGNFCYGHRKVSSIDSATPADSNPGATTQIDYHYTIDSVPSWAKAEETQNTFPQLRTDLGTPQAAQATLTNTSNGWQLTSAPDLSRRGPATSSDDQIVK